MEWYYLVERERIGPVSEEELRALVTNGTITAQTLVWHEGMEDWKAYGVVQASLQPASASPTAQDGTANCSQCGRPFPVDDMLPFEGGHVCAECKPVFLQKLREGVALPTGAARSPFPGTGGQTPNSELMIQARECLSGRWGLAIGGLILYQALSVVVNMIPFLGFIVSMLVTGPFLLGVCMLFMAIARKGDGRASLIFKGFDQFGTSLAAYILVFIFIMLWSLLLIIPGIIAGYSYFMTFFVIADNPELGPLEAIRQSKEIMQGKKWKLFCLFLRFLVYIIPFVAVMVLGVSMRLPVLIAIAATITVFGSLFWLTPYVYTSVARFYDDLAVPTETPHG